MERLIWQTFKEHLQANTDLRLQFKYANDQLVDAAYHITEIKQAPITSVDCGGVINSWTEIIVQLWEPSNERQALAMKVSKALSIINLVEKALPLNPEGMVKIEFGNSRFDTRQMLPQKLIVNGDDLIIDLRPDNVQCKAIERDGSCGTNHVGDKCGIPATESNPKLQSEKVTASASGCLPGSGCCS